MPIALVATVLVIALPKILDTTLTFMVHVPPLAAIVPPVRVSVVSAANGLNAPAVPPAEQTMLELGEAATVKPVGRASVTVVSGKFTEFPLGLVKTMVNALTSPG